MTTTDTAAIISELQSWLTRAKGGHLIQPQPVRKVRAVLDTLVSLKEENDRLMGELQALRQQSAGELRQNKPLEDWDDKDDDWDDEEDEEW